MSVINQFKALKLFGMAECYAEIQAQNLINTSKTIDTPLLVHRGLALASMPETLSQNTPTPNWVDA